MSLRDKYLTDKSIEQSGFSLLLSDDTRVLLARSGGANKSYNKRIDQLAKPYRVAIDQETMDQELSVSLAAQAFSEHVVLRWETKVDGEWQRGISPEEFGDPAGALVEDTPKNIQRLLEELPELFLVIQKESSRNSNFQKAGQDVAEENY